MPAHLPKNFQNFPAHTHFTRYAPHHLPKIIESGAMVAPRKAVTAKHDNALNPANRIPSTRVKKRPPTKPMSKAAAAATSPDKPVTQLQRQFVHFVARGESVQNAMFKAGFGQGISPSYGYKLLAMPAVDAVLKAEQAKFREDTKLERIHIIEMLREAYDMAKLMSEPASMVSAAREMGKLIGAYEPKKVEINIATGGQRAVQQLSDEELFRKIEEMKTDALALTHQADEAEEAEDALDRRN